ncbi:MAG: TonB-dependent receptor [Bradymonadales bacterium]|nr:TonB-dependent receptor [Bradymonadales bacterium]
MASSLRYRLFTLGTATAFLLLCLESATLRAQDSPEDPESDQNEVQPAPSDPEEFHYETVVVAERTPEDPFQSSRSVSALEREAIEEQAPRTTPEALAESPSVLVQQTNYGGGSPIIRGMIGPQNLILVDTVRFNNSVHRTGPTQYLNLLDPLATDHIEVLRGPGSVLYGSDAMGGVIRVSPLAPESHRADPAPYARGQALLRYGSAARQRTAHLHAEGGFDGLALLAGATYNGFDDLTGGRGIGEQIYSGYEGGSAMGHLTWDLPEGLIAHPHLSMVYLMTRLVDAGRTDKLVDSHNLQLYDNQDDLVYGRFQGDLEPLQTAIGLTLSYQRFFERKDSIQVEDDYRTERSTLRDEVLAHTLGLDLELTSWLLDRRLRLQYGGMWYNDWVSSDQTLRSAGEPWVPSGTPVYPDDSGYASYGGFLLAEGDLISTQGDRILRAGAGYRLHGSSADTPATGELPAVQFDYLGHVFFASLQYLHGETAALSASFAQGFRAPNLMESVMLGDTGRYFHIPNPDLQPERCDTFELLGRVRLGPIAASLTGHLSSLDSLLKRVPALWEGQSTIGGKQVVWNVNGRSGLLWGGEAELSANLPAGLSLAGSITTTWGQEELPDGPDVPLTRIPPLFGRLVLRYDTPRSLDWHGFVETFVQAADHQDRLSPEDLIDARIPEGGTPGWCTWNLRAGFTYHQLRLGLTLENLTNTDYKTHGSGVYGAGTNAVLTVSLAH